MTCEICIRVGRFFKIEFGISITYVGRSPEKDFFTDNFFVAIKASRLEREWASVEPSEKFYSHVYKLMCYDTINETKSCLPPYIGYAYAKVWASPFSKKRPTLLCIEAYLCYTRIELIVCLMKNKNI